MQTFDNKEAEELGVPCAVILSRCRYIHSKLIEEKRSIGGEYWIHRSNTAWEKEFPFWSRPTIKRAIGKLVEGGFLVKAPAHLPLPGDTRSFYKLGTFCSEGGTNLSEGGTKRTHIYTTSSTISIDRRSIGTNRTPTKEEVTSFFKSEGYRKEIGERAFDYYSERQWLDKFGNTVKDWKSTMRRVWFKDENREKDDSLRKYGI